MSAAPEDQSALQVQTDYEERRVLSAPTTPRGLSARPAELVDSKRGSPRSLLDGPSAIWRGDSEGVSFKVTARAYFDLVVTSPPYNIGKAYELKSTLTDYMAWQERIIDEIIPRLKDDGSLCWQVGNFVDNGQITPLDFEFAPIFKKHKLQRRNRIIWTFGHGLHTRRRFQAGMKLCSGIQSRTPTFDLDPVRIAFKVSIETPLQRSAKR